MAKGKSQKNGWLKWLCVGAVCLVVGGALTFGGIKIAEKAKADKPDNEQTEQTPENEQGTQATCFELEIATENVNARMA